MVIFHSYVKLPEGTWDGTQPENYDPCNVRPGPSNLRPWGLKHWEFFDIPRFLEHLSHMFYMNNLKLFFEEYPHIIPTINFLSNGTAQESNIIRCCIMLCLYALGFEGGIYQSTNPSEGSENRTFRWNVALTC